MPQDAFHSALRRRLREEIDKKMEYLCRGQAASFDEYRYRVGYLDGMNGAISLAEEVEKNLYSENPMKEQI